MTFSFNLMALVCVIAKLFLLTKNDILEHYNKFPNLGVYPANFPNLKGPKALPKIEKKNPQDQALYKIVVPPNKGAATLNRYVSISSFV